MARSSRGRGRKSSRRRQVDWVVNDFCYEHTPPYNLPANAIVFVPLTVPKWAVSYTDPAFAIQYPGFYLPEQDSGQVAYAVRGQVHSSPQSWVAGDEWAVGYRIAKFPVEYGTSFDAIVDPNYDLYLAQFANERFLWQDLTYATFNVMDDGGARQVRNISWKGVVKIEPNEALFLVIQNRSNGTVRTTERPFIRTLMRADG